MSLEALYLIETLTNFMREVSQVASRDRTSKRQRYSIHLRDSKHSICTLRIQETQTISPTQSFRKFSTFQNQQSRGLTHSRHPNHGAAAEPACRRFPPYNSTQHTTGRGGGTRQPWRDSGPTVAGRRRQWADIGPTLIWMSSFPLVRAMHEDATFKP